jgi:tight adherence protein C
MGSLTLLVALSATAVALMTLVLAFSWGAGEATGVARSLALLEKQIDGREVGRSDLPITDRILLPLLGSTRNLAFRLSPGGAASRISRQLDMAGNPPRWTAERIMGAKGVGLIAGGGLGFLFAGFSLKGIAIVLGAAAVGFFLPDLLLYNAAVKRQEELRKGLADALDMLTVCVEAGQGFDAALLQVARSASGPVAGEFARILSEIQIGKSRGDAFASLAKRTSVPEARNFVTALVQADRLGLPVAGVLREQSTQMRLVRRQHAEEQAQKVPVKILFPMFFGIFPALFIVIIGPGGIRMMQAFQSF